MKKEQFETRISRRDYIRAFLKYHKIPIVVSIITIILLIIGIITFLNTNKEYTISSFNDKDISGLNVPSYIMTASDNKINLIDLNTKKIKDTISFESSILSASDENKQYFIIYDNNTNNLYEIYAIKKDETYILAKDLIEENIELKITSIATSKYQYAYTTSDTIYIKDHDTKSIIRTIDFKNPENIKLHNGMLFASNKENFLFYSIQMSEPKLFENYSSSSAHMNNEGIIIVNNYGQQNNFSLLMEIDNLGKIKKVVQVEDNSLSILKSFPDDTLYISEGKDNQSILYGSLEKLKTDIYNFPIFDTIIKNDVFYCYKDNLVLVYNKQPYYQINTEVKELALLFDIYEISPRLHEIQNTLEISDLEKEEKKDA